jgi:serine protease Do
MGVVLLFAVFGFLAALSVVPTPFFGPGGWHREKLPKFVPVAYADDLVTNEDFAALARANRALTQVIQQTRPSVVSIETVTKARVITRRNPDGSDSEDNKPQFPFNLPFDFHGFGVPEGRMPERAGVGSGVIVSKDGYIITNNHVVEEADTITARLDDGRVVSAKLVGRDPKTDVAVVKIDENNLNAMPLGDSDRLSVGEFVIAIGSPFRLAQSVSLGIVSAKSRANIIGSANPDEVPYEDFIQTDAAINPGNSGGALINIYGQLVGINTAINSRTGGNEGVGFAVPINIARKVMSDLIEKGKVVRAWLGVYIKDLEPDVAKELGMSAPGGALISQVQDNSPAERAGLKPLDVVIEVDGDRVSNANQLRNYISSNDVGKKVRLTILRSGKRTDVSVTLGELPEQERVIARGRSRGETANGWMGITVEELTSKRAEELGYKGESGVVITKVESNSPAARAGLSEDVLILEIGGTPVRSLADFREATKKNENTAFIKWRMGSNYGLSVLKKENS